MEREVWMRGGMVLSILALVVLILVTPSLLGRTSTELASVPLLTVRMSRNESAFIVNLGAVWIAANVTFSLHVYFVDHVGRTGLRRNYFEYNVTVQREMDSQNRTVMVFTFPYEKDRQGAPIRITRPDGGDLHLVIPARGTVP
ncbi:MAG: hypothetical protein E6J99_02105 [Methanobacteriota archaeon]|nr:MAG: hypothetical protein E6J99_02105 [Euryarchaeota archaeon]